MVFIILHLILFQQIRCTLNKIKISISEDWWKSSWSLKSLHVSGFTDHFTAAQVNLCCPPSSRRPSQNTELKRQQRGELPGLLSISNSRVAWSRCSRYSIARHYHVLSLESTCLSLDTKCFRWWILWAELRWQV